MPKIEKGSLTQMIGLDRITDTGNIREQEKYGPNVRGEYPEDIQELAASIKTSGLLEPVIVKETEAVDGVKGYELIAGFRRRAAFQYLCSQGLGFNQIEAKIVTGDKLTIQLIENIQRADLSAPEREAAIYQMYDNGVKQNEIAAQLSKSKSFVSINISAYKMRMIAANNNINTDGIETSSLSELLNIPNADLPEVLRDLVNFGGTRTAARQIAAAYKESKNPSLEMSEADLHIDMSSGGEGKEPPPPPEPETAPDEPQPEINMDTPAPDETEPEPEPETEKQTESDKPEGKTEPPAAPSTRPEIYHADIDVNIILVCIADYIKGIQKKEPENDKDLLLENAKIEAANDIIALIHERLKNA